MANIPGFYGKMPSLGDFVSRRLSTYFVHTWDHWLQRVMSTGKERFGPDWLDIYLSSPIWRFALSPGISGPESWTGILMPSVDKVGRYFPLTLAVPVATVHWLPGLFKETVNWFEQLEQLASMTFKNELDAAELETRLQSLPFPEPSTRPTTDDRIEYASRADHFVFQATVENIEDTTQAFAWMGLRLLADAHTTYSLWCHCDADRRYVRVGAYRHMPSPEDLIELLMVREDRNDVEVTMPQEPMKDKSEEADVYLQTFADEVQTNAAVVHPPVQWHSFALTDAGKHRRINEDAYLARPEIGLWVVADGMGGHSAGDKASSKVVDTLNALYATGHLESFIACTMACLHAVNADLLEMADQLGDGSIMGTTVVVLLAVGQRCAAIWAGDSRLYRLRDGRLDQLTRDHSLMAELSRGQDFSMDESAVENIDNIVTRALGADVDVDLDSITFEARAGDLFLLCSDGLTKEVPDPEIEEILKDGDCREAAQRLINLSLERGARDNVTVVTAKAASAMV